jgi:hypothetical protein
MVFVGLGFRPNRTDRFALPTMRGVLLMVDVINLTRR